MPEVYEEEVIIKRGDTGPDEGGFFSFRTMITPSFIRIIYVFGMIVITLGGILMVADVIKAQYPLDATTFGILWIIIGNLIWRIACEVLILFFSMHDILSSIEKNIKQISTESSVEDTDDF